MDYPHIVKTPGTCAGLPRVEGTRISVNLIVEEVVRARWTPEEVLIAHPDLTMAQIHSALAYYFDNREEVDRAMENTDLLVDELGKRFPSKLAAAKNLQTK